MKTLTVDIRNAHPQDAVAIAMVHHQSWKNAYSGLIPHRALNAMLSRRGSQWWQNAIERSTCVLVIEFGGTVTGYATLGRNRARQLVQNGEVYELYLLPEFQGIGLGRLLFEAARQKLADSGLRGTVVWALTENTGALGFYHSLGGKDMAQGREVFDDRTLHKTAFTWD